MADAVQQKKVVFGKYSHLTVVSIVVILVLIGAAIMALMNRNGVDVEGSYASTPTTTVLPLAQGYDPNKYEPTIVNVVAENWSKPIWRKQRSGTHFEVTRSSKHNIMFVRYDGDDNKMVTLLDIDDPAYKKTTNSWSGDYVELRLTPGQRVQSVKTTVDIAPDP